MLHLAVQECAASVLPLLGVAERWSGWRVIAVAFCVKRKSKQPRMRRLACLLVCGLMVKTCFVLYRLIEQMAQARENVALFALRRCHVWRAFQLLDCCLFIG